MWNNIIQETHKNGESSLDQKIKINQHDSEYLMLEAKHETSKKDFKQLCSIHNKYRSQKKVSVSVQTDDEVTLTM